MTATWSEIANSEVAAGAPVTTALMTALRDRSEAMLYGSADSPIFSGVFRRLEIQAPTSNVSTVQFDYDISELAEVRVEGLLQSNDGGTIQIQVRNGSGTWREMCETASFGNANRWGIFDIRVLNLDQAMGHNVTYGAIVYAASDSNSGLDTTDDVDDMGILGSNSWGSAYSSYDEVYDAVRIVHQGGSRIDANNSFFYLSGTTRQLLEASL